MGAVSPVRRRLGLSLIEAAIVLSIAAFFISATIFLLASARSNSQIAEAKKITMTIVHNLDAMFPSGDIFGSVSGSGGLGAFMQQINISGLVRDRDTGAIVSPFGGEVQVWRPGDLGLLNNQFVVRFTEVPRASCVRLAGQIFMDSAVRLIINGNEIVVVNGAPRMDDVVVGCNPLFNALTVVYGI